MLVADIPTSETERLATLRSYEVLDTESESAFDELATLAARLTGSPVAVISLIDAERQWYKARHGIETRETHRDFAFCAHAILHPTEVMTVPDSWQDERFRDNPLVEGDRGVRAYVGAPLVSPDGHALGTLCVIDHVPREFDAQTIAIVRTLAQAVSANLELRRALRRAERAATTDWLTGLPNRQSTRTRLANLLELGEPVGIVVVCLDAFKEVNDSEGLAAGDTVLRATADTLVRLAEPEDFVGRIGGDKFVVLMTGAGASRPNASRRAEQIVRALDRPVPVGAREVRLGVTLGVALAPEDATEPEMAVRVAERAMQRVKQEGRGSVGHVDQSDSAGLRTMVTILRAFDGDLAADATLPGATVHLQPIVRLDRVPDPVPRLLAVEALARWSHPDLGQVPVPDLFAAIGPERAALLGRQVREQALAAFAAMRRRGLAEARLALNLSATEVAQPDIAALLARQVKHAGLSFHSIEIEITEETLLDQMSDATLDQLARLRSQGARLVLDDFGTGNSGLSHLLRLPLDGLKLDKRFIQRLGQDARADVIVRTSVSLAHNLNLELVAEGIETEAQAAAVRALGCDGAQGFLFGRPMSVPVLRTWLRDRSQMAAATSPANLPAVADYT